MQVSITKYIIKKLQQALGIIQDTDTASQAIAKGKFVFWKGTLKKAKSAISSGDTLSSSNLDDVSGGALNNEMGEANSMYAGTPGIVPTPPAGNSVLTNHGWQSFISSVPSFKIPILGGDSDYTTCSTRAIGTKFDELSEHIATNSIGDIKNNNVSAGTLNLYAKDNICMIEFADLTLATGLSAGSSVDIGTIPSDHRPNRQAYFFGVGVASGAAHEIWVVVNTNGTVSVINKGSASSKLYANGQVVYMTH